MIMTIFDELTTAKKKLGRPPGKYTHLAQHPLKEFFADLGITQTAIADKLGINKTLLSLYLGGRMIVPAEHEALLQGLAEELRAETG
jgi:hypothetical protein